MTSISVSVHGGAEVAPVRKVAGVPRQSLRSGRKPPTTSGRMPTGMIALMAALVTLVTAAATAHAQLVNWEVTPMRVRLISSWTVDARMPAPLGPEASAGVIAMVRSSLPLGWIITDSQVQPPAHPTWQLLEGTDSLDLIPADWQKGVDQLVLVRVTWGAATPISNHHALG